MLLLYVAELMVQCFQRKDFPFQYINLPRTLFQNFPTKFPISSKRRSGSILPSFKGLCRVFVLKIHIYESESLNRSTRGAAETANSP